MVNKEFGDYKIKSLYNSQEAIEVHINRRPYCGVESQIENSIRSGLKIQFYNFHKPMRNDLRDWLEFGSPINTIP